MNYIIARHSLQAGYGSGGHLSRSGWHLSRSGCGKEKVVPVHAMKVYGEVKV